MSINFITTSIHKPKTFISSYKYIWEGLEPLLEFLCCPLQRSPLFPVPEIMSPELEIRGTLQHAPRSHTSTLEEW